MSKAEKDFEYYLRILGTLIRKSPRPVTKKEVAHEANLGTSVVHRHLTRLTRSKRVAIVPQEDEKAEHLYLLTKGGQQNARKLLEEHAPDLLAF